MKKNLIIHLVLIGAILIIAGVAIFRLYRWNNSGTSDPEADIEQIDPEEFDIETLDMIIPMDASRFEGHEDDGQLTILCIGNNPFTDERGEKGLANLIAKKTGATVYDAAFPYSGTAYHNVPINPNFPWDHFNLPSIAECLRAGVFTSMESAINYMEDPALYRPGLDALEAVDMEKVDVLIIMYDSTDYNSGTPCDNEDAPQDLAAFTGGLRYFLDTVNTAWPHVRTFVMTPTYAQYQDENGELHSGTVYDAGNGPLPYYVQKEIDAVVGSGVSIVDNYYGTINEDNYEEYMTDHMHYNDAGRELLADRISDIINNKMSTVKSAG
ncbi:MAG: SGNH/GDSL hydrolase family protein [Lachnospiraceae bacterium]|nr:SGNH/GDSL hydrolase family protein [Lachnospiraceae bacterium]